MSRPAKPRPGAPVQVRGRPFRFSYWPMYRTTRRYGLQAHIYATNPWALIRMAIRDQCPSGSKPEATALLEQAHFFYTAASNASEWAAKPLLLYYSLLNLAKGYILTRAVRPSLDQAQHGLSERLKGARREIVDAHLDAFPSHTAAKANVFADFWNALSGNRLAAPLQLDLPCLLPQVVAGHRLWCEAADAPERFINIEGISLRQDKMAKALWAVIQVHSGTLAPHEISRKELLKASCLADTFRDVEGFQDGEDWTLLFEHKVPVTYSHRVSDEIQGLINGFRHRFWATATTVAPYRSYYLYVAPAAERNQVLPQLLSIYAISYYLGSIARYRPQQFAAVMDGPYGAFVQEFLASQPSQFIYLVASEFAKQEITRAELA